MSGNAMTWLRNPMMRHVCVPLLAMPGGEPMYNAGARSKIEKATPPLPLGEWMSLDIHLREQT